MMNHHSITVGQACRVFTCPVGLAAAAVPGTD